MFVKFFPGVAVYVLCIMNRQINTRLQDQYVILGREVQDNRVNQVAQQHSEQDFTDEVDEVPLAAVASGHLLLQIDGQGQINRMAPQPRNRLF